jgi:hypothetical protein
MPTGKNYLIFGLVNLGFIAQIALFMYYTSAAKVKANWNEYRCNPSYWMYSDSISDDFNYCVQDSQVNMMGTLMQPMTYMVSSLASFAEGATQDINNSRGMISNIRDFLADIIPNIFSVFINLIVEFQRMIIAIKDMFAKMVGMITTFMFMLDSLSKLMISGAGVFGAAMPKSCFHPDTKVKTKSGDIFAMKDLPLGAELEDGGKVFSVMKIDNQNKDPYYKINGGINGETIYVTGHHFIYNKITDKFVKVMDHPDAVIESNNIPEWVSCLITTNQRIPIGQHTFWDWEDDELTK